MIPFLIIWSIGIITGFVQMRNTVDTKRCEIVTEPGQIRYCWPKHGCWLDLRGAAGDFPGVATCWSVEKVKARR